MAVLEPPSNVAFSAGVQAGVARASRYGLEARPDLLARLAADPVRLPDDVPEALAEAKRLMSQSDVSDRFTELFAEMVTVAVVSRHAYADAPLQASEIETYLDHSFSIFNSFRHA
jgi:hypothetical protein